MIDDKLLAELRGASGALGEAQAFVHVAGYSFGLGFAKIKWLLQDDRWRQCGFDTLEAFAASIQFDKSMRAAAEQRKELVALFKTADKEKPLSNVKLAKTLNVAESTVRADSSRNREAYDKNDNKNNGEKSADSRNREPAPLPSGERAARLVTNKVNGTQEKKERREQREADLGARQNALPTKKSGVVYADCEWENKPWSLETGMDRAAANHYPTSSLEAIKARDVPSIAADDCVLFLWATVPMLPQALEVMAAWGFTYKSQLIWIKDRVGTGYWFRNQHELLLVGTRGDVPAPAMGDQWVSVIDAPVTEHSAKPEIFLEMIEEYFPNLPKIELNRRGPPRPGWSAWGYEAEQPMDAAE